MTKTLPVFETLLYEQQNGVAILTMNRPDRLNSLNATLHRELGEAWEYTLKDDDIRVAVIAGTGRAFCSGADLRERGEARQQGQVIEREKSQSNLIPGRPWLTGSFPDNNPWLEFDKPIVAAVNGLVVGAGTMILGAVDILVANEACYVADAHVTYAGWPGTGEALDITDKMPWGLVSRIGFEGITYRVSGKRAHQVGFYTELVDADRVLPRAIEIAEMIAKQPPEAVRALRRISQRSRDVALHDALVYGEGEARRVAAIQARAG